MEKVVRQTCTNMPQRVETLRASSRERDEKFPRISSPWRPTAARSSSHRATRSQTLVAEVNEAEEDQARGVDVARIPRGATAISGHATYAVLANTSQQTARNKDT